MISPVLCYRQVVEEYQQLSVVLLQQSILLQQNVLLKLGQSTPGVEIDLVMYINIYLITLSAKLQNQLHYQQYTEI